MVKVTCVKSQENFRLYVEFNDGVAGTIDLSSRLFGPVFEPLQDPKFFEQVSIDEFGVITWPNGADLAPDALYQQLRAKETQQSSTMSKS